MADISALERQKQILKQAIKIRNSPAEEERLGDLVTQWRQAGRDIVEMLYQVIPKPEPAAEGGILPSSEWENGFKPLEPDTIAKSTEEEEENAEAEDWNYGTMMRTLQVDPDLLGWDREAEDWVGS
jgi:ribosomal protein L12E/L44/L45/RPP1/RPP2